MNTTRRITLPLLKNVPLILFVVIFALFSLLDQRFFTVTNFSNILLSSSFIGIVAVGMTFVLLTGGIDLSVGATMYITAGILALLLELGWPLWAVIPIGLLAGTLWGCLNAFLIAKVKIIPFMATLGTLTVGRGVGLLITQSRNISVPPEMRFGAQNAIIPITVFALVVLVAYIVLNYTALGRQIYAMGNDAEAAKKAGLNTTRLTASVYIISGFCAALGAVIALSQQGMVSASFGEGIEFRAIAASVLGGASLFGGVGNVFPGTVIGVLLIQMIANGMIYLQVDLYLQDMVAALVILFAVFIDAVRIRVIRRLERRNIRVEKGPERVKTAEPIPS
jgi:ribose transport system permease protein